MTSSIRADDPRHQQALDDFAAEFHIRIDDVLLPTHWKVALVDGQPEIVVNPAGMRALALTAPRPDAQAFVEELIAAVETAFKKES